MVILGRYADPYDAQYLEATSILAEVQRRAALEARIYEAVSGDFRPGWDEVFPGPRTARGRAAYERALRQAAPIAPQIHNTRLGGAIGSVSWGGDSVTVDERLKVLDLHSFAERLFTQGFVSGIIAAWAHLDDAGRPRISRLSGYLEPILDENDVDRVTGLFQAWVPNGAAGRWNVRVYDFATRTMREYRGLREPEKYASYQPAAEVTLATVPRLRMVAIGADGLPRGELAAGWPLIKAEYADQLRIIRVAEMYGVPLTWVRGGVRFPSSADDLGKPIELDQNGEIGFAYPQALADLFTKHNRTLERIREFFSLPYGMFGNQAPSGEALAQANIRFNQASQRYARLMSSLLTEVVADYAQLAGISEPPEVEVVPNEIGRLETQVQNAVLLYEKGIIPLAAAVQAVREAVPGWSVEEARQWIESQKDVVTPADVARILGGGGNA